MIDLIDLASDLFDLVHSLQLPGRLLFLSSLSVCLREFESGGEIRWGLLNDLLKGCNRNFRATLVQCDCSLQQ